MSNEEDLTELSRYVYYIDSKHRNFDSRIKSGEAIELENLNYKILKTEDNTTNGMQARNWASSFVIWYKEVHLHSSLNFVTPVQCHSGVYKDILEKRNAVYEQAKQEHPERWGSRNTRDWSPYEQVALNPIRDEMHSVSGNE